jgi:glycerol-3-phosphate acyltransferase PlsY
VRGETVVATAVAVGLGYVAGSVPVAVLVGRAHRFDPRAVGDRNPGWWNMRGQLGDRAAVPVLVGDTAKGVVAGLVGVGLAPAGAWGVGYAAVGAAMVGHAWPAFAGFRGGRSILTFAGGMCVLAPSAALPAVAAFGLAAATGHTAVGARLAVGAFPALQLVLESAHRTAATGLLMSFIGLRFAMAARSGVGPATPGPAGAERPGGEAGGDGDVDQG